MIASCSKCGKNYRIDPDKISGDAIRFKCKACGSVVTARKPASLSDTQSGQITSAPSAETADLSVDLPAAEPIRFGLRFKMTLLFFVVPIGLFAASGVFFLTQMKVLSGLITKESSAIVSELGQRIILEKSRSVAAQVKLFLDSNDLPREMFDKHPEFKRIAVQEVGKTGYSALYAVPDAEGIWKTWSHTNPKILGIDMTKLKNPLGKNFDGFWKIYSGASTEKESEGYYTWQDKDGSFREKYMACTPVTGTPFIVAATTYMDEFTEDVNDLQKRADSVTAHMQLIIYTIFGITLVLIGSVVALYGNRLTTRLRSLTNVAERISVGDLGAEIEADYPRDEIGALATSIQRMQDSLRVLMRRRRN
ncbi:MAG: HAMP domain-containing protein [Pseudomonadota bacterium]